MFEGLCALIRDSKDSLRESIYFAKNAISTLADDNSTENQKKHAKITVSQSVEDLFLSFICLFVLVPMIFLMFILSATSIVLFSFSVHFILGVLSLIVVLICALGLVIRIKYSDLFYKILNKIVNPRKKKNYKE